MAHSKRTAKALPTRAKRSRGPDWSFPPDTVEFLSELQANNNREWFTKNKARYEFVVKQPAADFCDHMVVALENMTGMAHTSKVFRVHRDIRFSKDKTPYKSYLHMLFQPAGREVAPKWFVGLEPDKFVLGAGMFTFEKALLNSYRQRVAGREGEALGRQLEKLQRDGVRVREPELKRVPAGFEIAHAFGDLLRHKGLSVWCDHADGTAAASKSDVVKTTTAHLKRLKSVFDWLSELTVDVG